jgi:hypothetical protein
MDKKREKKINKFFKALYRECNEGSIRIQFKPSNKKKYVALKKFIKIPGILDANEGKEEGCFGITTRMEVEDQQDKIVQIPALWVKFTGSCPEEVSTNSKDGGLIPSVIVDSPERIFFWILKKPAGKEEIERVKSILKKLAIEFEGDTTSTSTNIRQVFRIPESYRLNKRNDVLIRYDLSELEKWCESREPNGSSLEEEYEEDEEQEKKVVKYESITLRDIYDYSNPTYLIKSILERYTLSILGASPGVGKSIIALSIIKSVLTGESLWGKFEVLKKGPVLLVDEETPRPWLKRRVKNMEFQESLLLSTLHFQGVRVDGDAYFDALMKKIEEVRPVLVVFDSLVRFHRQNESDASSMSLVMDKFRNIVNWGTTVLVIHHHKKGGAKKGEKLRGSTDISAAIDVEFSLTKRKGNRLVFESGKSRIEPVRPIILRMMFSKKRIEVTCEGRELSNDEKILSEVKEFLKKGESGVKEIKEALKEKGFKVGDQKLRDILEEADEKGIFTTRKEGPRKIVYGLNLKSIS